MYKKGGSFGTGQTNGDLCIVGDFSTIPLINVAGIYSERLGDRMAVAEKIRDACSRVGFFYIEGHGVPEESVNSVFEMGKHFFALDFEEKMKFFINNTPHYRGYTPLYGAGNPNKDGLGSKLLSSNVFVHLLGCEGLIGTSLSNRASLHQMPTKLSTGDTILS